MNKNLKFIDLFAGIGGFRLALESIGAKCVFSCEIDPHAIAMYQANFKEDPKGDITQLDPSTLPDFDILCAGFPCQAFSISGKQRGFEDSRGTLFFDICRILEEKQPTAFILENVKNLEKHDKGNTMSIILKSLKELGYSVSYQVLNAKDFGVPQNRERVIIVGHKGGKIFDFSQVQNNPVDSMNNFLEPQGDFEYLEESEYTLLAKEQIKVQKSGLIFCGYRNKNIRKIGVKAETKHLSRVHKQPNRIYSAKGIHPTLASQEQSGRYFIYVNGKVRKLTLNECYKFMGFPDDFIKVGAKGKLYERIGNSVCVPMIRNIAQEVSKQFWNQELFSR
ncbi:DNA (cytosine-5-)-methyltransferase [Psittacicella gerlachiana]|uniref:Cytosine-specific methyltransferase n=2 Tax=Psittacicella gerlachiana TaxID=2028574 RepID=A0A3A1YE90_9GAMM|nr:DNA (cytosine-5-)-methyltransferase [Psittacicella gerlachiana]